MDLLKINNKRKGEIMYSKERHRLRGIWKGMIARCTNPNNPMYKRYGGKSIYSFLSPPELIISQFHRTS